MPGFLLFPSQWSLRCMHSQFINIHGIRKELFECLLTSGSYNSSASASSKLTYHDIHLGSNMNSPSIMVESDWGLWQGSSWIPSSSAGWFSFSVGSIIVSDDSAEGCASMLLSTRTDLNELPSLDTNLVYGHLVSPRRRQDDFRLDNDTPCQQSIRQRPSANKGDTSISAAISCRIWKRGLNLSRVISTGRVEAPGAFMRLRELTLTDAACIFSRVSSLDPKTEVEKLEQNDTKCWDSKGWEPAMEAMQLWWGCRSVRGSRVLEKEGHEGRKWGPLTNNSLRLQEIPEPLQE